MQISWNSCIQRNRLTQQRTNSYTTFGATGGFGYTGERCKSRCNRGVDQVHISTSGADQTIRGRSKDQVHIRRSGVHQKIRCRLEDQVQIRRSGADQGAAAAPLSENKRCAAPPEFATIYKRCLTPANYFQVMNLSSSSSSNSGTLKTWKAVVGLGGRKGFQETRRIAYELSTVPLITSYF